MYKLSSNIDYFIQENNDGGGKVIIRDTAEQFILNEPSMVIFKKIMNAESIDEIVNYILDIYNSTKEEVEKDVYDILNFLSIYNLVVFNDKRETIVDYVGAINENNYNIVKDFIHKNKNEFSIFSSIKDYYSPRNIRAHIMNNKEYYYMISDAGEIKAIVSIVPNLGQTSVVLLTTMVFSKDLSEREIIRYGKLIIEKIKKTMINVVNKIRCSFYCKKGEIPIAIKVLKELGFKEETRLQNEYEENDILMYTLFYYNED